LCGGADTVFIPKAILIIKDSAADVSAAAKYELVCVGWLALCFSYYILECHFFYLFFFS
jgi:hypothetical protein